GNVLTTDPKPAYAASWFASALAFSALCRPNRSMPVAMTADSVGGSWKPTGKLAGSSILSAFSSMDTAQSITVPASPPLTASPGTRQPHPKGGPQRIVSSPLQSVATKDLTGVSTLVLPPTSSVTAPRPVRA